MLKSYNLSAQQGIAIYLCHLSQPL